MDSVIQIKPAESPLPQSNNAGQDTDTSSSSWRNRKTTLCMLALGGAAIAAYRNHEASCPVWRSIVSYAAWQLPTMIYYLGTEPLNCISPGARLARDLQSEVKKALNISSGRGICVAASAVWLSAPLSIRSETTLRYIPSFFAIDDISEALGLVYPECQSGNFDFSGAGLDKFLGKHGFKRMDHFVIPSLVVKQLSDNLNSPVDLQEIRGEFEGQKKYLQILNMHLVDEIPLEKLAVGESFAAVMIARIDDPGTSHMIGISRVADGFVIYDPESGIPMKSDSIENCLTVLRQVEVLHQKKLYNFFRYQSSELESDAQNANGTASEELTVTGQALLTTLSDSID